MLECHYNQWLNYFEEPDSKKEKNASILIKILALFLLTQNNKMRDQ